jgi:glutathione S-transferase
LDEYESEFAELVYQINEGGIRHNTDEREAASAAILSLVEGLKADIDKLRTQPRDLADRLEGLESQAVQSLEVAYQAQHRDLMRAWTSIRMALRKDPRAWPQQRAETYGETKASFDRLVAEMRSEGEEYFAGETETTLDVYVALCGMELDGRPVDWDSPEYERHVNSLKRKKLLELRLR